MAKNRWTRTLLDPYRKIGDPVADAVIQSVFTKNEVDVINSMMKSIEENQHLVAVELPDDIEQFLNDTDDWPEWADQEQIRLGQQLFSRYGMQMTMALFCWSLPSSYSCAKGVQVLGLTRRIGKEPHRRILETAQFILDVMAEGGLEAGGHGVRTAQKIRLLHTTIRYHIQSKPGWNADWGVPINQEDLAGTLLSFALLPRTLVKMGLDFTAQEEAAFFHCWRVIGRILGIEEALLPKDVEDGLALWNAILEHHVAPSEPGRALTAALVGYMKERIPGTVFDGVPAMLVRELCGDKIADAVGVPKADWTKRLLRPVRWLLRWTDEAQDRSGSVAKISGTFSRKLIEGLHYVERGGKKVNFTIPKSLQDSWGLESRSKSH